MKLVKMVLTKKRVLYSVLALASLLCVCSGLSPRALDAGKPSTECSSGSTMNRRSFWQELSFSSVATASALSFLLPEDASAAAGPPLSELQSATQQARKQLDAVPAIIQKEEWDRIRALLIQPPLSDFWTTTKRGSNILKDIANAVGDAGGDELNILELREDLQSHLRYLDMAAYNNVFNPIRTEGTTGATKELVRSYYEDPKNELKASIAAFDGILTEMTNTGQ